MAEIVNLNTQTTLDLSAERILNGALAANLKSVIVIGEAGDGPYHASTTSNIPEMLFRLEMFKRSLIDRAYHSSNT